MILSLDAPNAVEATILTLSQTHINGGESSTITCHAFSVPHPSYNLLFNGVIIANGTPDGAPFTFTIGPVNYNDEGSYSCQATNVVGSDTQNIFLNVSGSNSLVPIDIDDQEISVLSEALCTI